MNISLFCYEIGCLVKGINIEKTKKNHIGSSTVDIRRKQILET